MSSPGSAGAPTISTLVVDDDPRIADLHAAFVGRVEGFSVVGLAYSLHDAYEAIRAASPDLLLLDLYLPDGHGLALLRRLRESRGPHPDAIIITASRDVGSVRLAMQLGAVHYVVKPFGFRQLAERLEGYRAVRAKLTRMRHASQAEVDALFGLLRTSGPSGLSRGSTVPTMSRIVDVVRAADAPLTAAAVAQAVGISRATAQRYLAQLVEAGLIELDLQYGSAGRPSHLYSAPVP